MSDIAIYSIHSQKGGVGKTSLSLAIAGFSAFFKNNKTVIIDADLTGTSIIDLFCNDYKTHIQIDNINKYYFNDLILASPYFINDLLYKSKAQTIENLFCFKIPSDDNIYFMPSSPILSSITKVIPLISQEDYLGFFSKRMDDIIKYLIKEGFESIIIDHPPGLFGISKSDIHLLSNKSKDYNASILLVTTPDPTDYRALIPSYSELFEHKKITKDLKKNIFFNKYVEKDPIDDLQKMFKDLKTKNFPDSRATHKHLSEIIKDFEDKIIAGKGLLGAPLISNIDMKNIIPTIKRLKTAKLSESGIMNNWCHQIGTGLGYYDKNLKI
jgi:cellulose biosynthesis protein BcsQ